MAGQLPAPTGLSASLEPWRFRLLGLSIVALLFGFATFAGTELQDAVMGGLGLVFVVALVFALGGRRVPWPVAVVLAAPILGATILDEGWTKIAGSWYHIPLLVVATFSVAGRVLYAERADEDVVVGSICAYLLAALSFASIYAGIETLSPGAFGLDPSEGEARTYGRLLYFSLVTITTLGFGDVSPVHEGAQALVCLQSVVGILFPAVVVARVVALATVGGSRPFAPPPPRGERFGGRYRLLAILLVVSLLPLPWLEENRFTWLIFAGVLLAQLLTALYATGQGGIRAIAAWGLAIVALGSAVWPGPPDGRVSSIGLVAQLLFFCLVTFELLNWLVRERHVTREVLFASIATYLVLGFALAAAFQLVETLSPGSIHFPDGMQSNRSTLVYFSFMTLTTTGYGDITPAAPLIEQVAAVGALLGVFYPAVLLARLLSLYSADEDA